MSIMKNKNIKTLRSFSAYAYVYVAIVSSVGSISADLSCQVGGGARAHFPNSGW